MNRVKQFLFSRAPVKFVVGVSQKATKKIAEKMIPPVKSEIGFLQRVRKFFASNARPSTLITQEKKSILSKTAVQSTIGFAAGTGTVVAVNAATAGIISTVGFSTTGVVAGSIAAGTQAGIGSVAAGSFFAGFQSLGALGMGVLGTAVLPVALTTGSVVAGVIVFNKYRPIKK